MDYIEDRERSAIALQSCNSAKNKESRCMQYWPGWTRRCSHTRPRSPCACSPRPIVTCKMLITPNARISNMWLPCYSLYGQFYCGLHGTLFEGSASCKGRADASISATQPSCYTLAQEEPTIRKGLLPLLVSVCTTVVWRGVVLI